MNPFVSSHQIKTLLIQWLYYRLPKSAGVLLLGTGGRIMPNSVEYMESACEIEEDIVIHPFAFRTHTHALGKSWYFGVN